MIDIILLIILGVVALGAATFFIIRFFKMDDEKKKELIIKWLTGAVVTAQNLITEKSDTANKEKFEQVLREFKKNAPLTYKLFAKFSKNINIEELIEAALTTLKNTKF